MVNWNIDDLPAFIAVADQQGVSAAATVLGRPKSTISRSISRLEDDLGLKLFVRTARALRLTHDGKQVYAHALQIMEQVDQANADIAGLRRTPSGPLTVAMPMAFSREIIAPHLPDFIAAYPEIQLELIVASGQQDLLRDQIDIAVAVGAQPDSDLIQQKLVEAQLIWFAAPDVAAQLDPKLGASQLGAHIKICETRYRQIKIGTRQGDTIRDYSELDLTRIAHVNDPVMVRDMIAGGAGLGFAPSLYLTKRIADGTVVPLYDQHRIMQASHISLLYPGRRLLPRKAQLFIAFLQDITAPYRR